jgi:hypothetical protein
VQRYLVASIQIGFVCCGGQVIRRLDPCNNVAASCMQIVMYKLAPKQSFDDLSDGTDLWAWLNASLHKVQCRIRYIYSDLHDSVR